MADFQGGRNRSPMARRWQTVVLCGFRREAYVSRHQCQARISGRSAPASVPITAWCYWLRSHSRWETFSHRRASGAKRFRTIYRGAELAVDVEEMTPANLETRIEVGSVKAALSAGRLRIRSYHLSFSGVRTTSQLRREKADQRRRPSLFRPLCADTFSI
jgi:hypothetical protein